MSNRITAILDQLRAEESDLQDKLDNIKQQAKSIETALSKVRKAILSLKPKAASDQNHKSTVSKEQILEITTTILETGPQSETQLKKRVEKKVASTGKSLTGFAMRFKNVLKDGRFTQVDDKIQLATATPSQTS